MKILSCNVLCCSELFFYYYPTLIIWSLLLLASITDHEIKSAKNAIFSCASNLMDCTSESVFQMRKIVWWTLSVCICFSMFNILILNSRVREETKNSLVLVHQIIIGDGNIEVGNNELRVGVILDCVNNNFWTKNISTLLPTIFSYKTKKIRIILTQDLFEKRKKEVRFNQFMLDV